MKRAVKVIYTILFVLNVIVVAGLLLTGYSYVVNPEKIPVTAFWGLFFPFFLLGTGVFLVLWIVCRWRYALLSVAALIVCYKPVMLYVSIRPGGTAPEGALTVLTYNLHDFDGIDTPLDRYDNAAVRFLLDENADIVCLQECHKDRLSRAMYDSLFTRYPYHHYTHQGKGFTSLAVYSKYKIEKVDSIACAASDNISVAYTIVTPRGYVLMVNNHFESNAFDPEKKKDFKAMMLGDMQRSQAKDETKYILKKFMLAAVDRTPQMRAVAEYIDMYKDMPVIVCGDFNEIPISYNRQLFGRLTDTFTAAGCGFGWTYCHNGMRVRIDNILCSKDITPHTCEVRNKVYLSDHFPVVCTLSLAEDEE